MNFDLHKFRLYGILDMGYVAPVDVPRIATEMLDGGVEILQLRVKRHLPADILQLARLLVPLCRSAGVPFILNDHPSLVAESGADGVHVGQDDMSVQEARSLVGSGKIVGLSTHSLHQAISAAGQKPDYIGFGPLFSTPTKPDYVAIGTSDILQAHKLVPLPIYCIGGIKLEKLPSLIAAGAQRVVIVSGILQAENIADYCRACRLAIGRVNE